MMADDPDPPPARAEASGDKQTFLGSVPSGAGPESRPMEPGCGVGDPQLGGQLVRSPPEEFGGKPAYQGQPCREVRSREAERRLARQQGQPT